MNVVPWERVKHIGFTKARLTVSFSEGMKGIVCEDNGVPVAVCLMEKWSPYSVFGHIACDKPMALRSFLPEIFNYVFNTCGREMFLGIIPTDNPKSIKFHKHLGFKEQHRIKDGWSKGVDYILVRMLKSECKFLKQIEEAA